MIRFPKHRRPIDLPATDRCPAPSITLALILVSGTLLLAATAPACKSSSRSSDRIDATQKQRAIDAKDELARRLSGRLLEVLDASGPAAAVAVCSAQAAPISESVATDLGVAIGRTSFRLRNPDNRPPEWARPSVTSRAETPVFVPLDKGRLGAVFPIRLKQPCQACHGPAETLTPEVREALATLYPDDRATGFRVGDLRGWFWVDVPASAAK